MTFATLRMSACILAASFLGVTSPATAQDKAEFNLTAASYLGATHVGHRSFVEFIKNTEEASGGQLSYAFHPHGALFSQAQVLQAGRLGTADLVSISPAIFHGELPFSADAGTLMFLWDINNFDKAYEVLKPELEAELAKQNLKPLWMTGTVTQWFMQKETDLDNPDWSGRKIRGFGGTSTRMIEILGGTNVSVSNNELAMAASTGVIHGLGTSLGSFANWGVERQLPCMLAHNNVPLITIIAMNLDAWNRLPASLQEIMNTEAENVQKRWVDILREEELPAQEKFAETTGCVQNFSETQREEWRERLEPIFAEFRSKHGDKGEKFIADVLALPKE